VRKWGLIAVGVLAGMAGVLALLVWGLTFHPDPVQDEEVVCAPHISTLRPGAALKVLSWNVQFMAGKNHVFFYDLLDGSGPDEKPSMEEVEATLGLVAGLIIDEDPDIVLLQEMDDGAARTGHEDQLQRLLELLPPDYGCHSSALYWKADFVPHPRIMGSVGMKLSTLSKYRITNAVRHQLAMIPADPVSRQFGLKRAVLEVRLPVEGGGELVVFNTHLDAFAQGSDTMEKQVTQVARLLEEADASSLPWLAGGDFNLLPSRNAYDRLPAAQQEYYLPETELGPLYNRYQSVPGPAETGGENYALWFTHFPNDPSVKAPDRTIDYIFFSDLIKLGDRRVLGQHTLVISDHLPLLVEVTLPR